eukprot:CAMPEP_0114523286 /NCGR_PEP_ID=MMETSP0109-20121206/21210_1 /TAXON_ID=29199 /ORGANISM="Chlorarachnion reptans, Strain CCCM449" /LENGTH=184 /DNA_ID=CAMNT_0001704591 /DNA_START=44 /DNA_END=598 /DNA_ORIENTATION=+
MGADSSRSSDEARYKRELLKLSWRLVLTVQEQAAAKTTDKSSHSGDVQKDDDKSAHSGRSTDINFQGTLSVRPFHEDFEEQFFKYCPDLKTQFPSNYAMVSKMIARFIGTAIDAKDHSKMAKTFAKGHRKYKLNRSHFEGFASALVDTLQDRLGKFGTIELIKIWREVTLGLINRLEKEYNKKV